ncbi:MAG: FkbM family methyltransferase [Bryobacteraceae bacterium]|nr:FkbM family methyltransferase [Bryobacteraceae bacterium]
MSFRERVKTLLRMCGHAFVSTVHERLNHTDRQLDVLVDQNNRMAQSQTALLQASIHIIETSRKADAEFRDAVERLEKEVLRVRGETKDFLEREAVRQVEVEACAYEFANPEVGLLSYLYSFLPAPAALDIGANAGEVSERLLEAGYRVYGFEPCPATYEKLVRRLGDRPGFQAFPFALGADDGEMTLHVPRDASPDGRYGDPTAYASLWKHPMPDDLPFETELPAAVRRLDGLHREGVLPDDVAIVKIDTEGFDLEVIRGMGQRRYAVVTAEFWDRAIPFAGGGAAYTLEELAAAMKERGYRWHIVLYRVWGRPHLAFYANHRRAVPKSWGNAVFFREWDLFREAHQWCAAALPRTFFRPAPP